MLKFVATVRRLGHVSHEELIDVWKHKHAPHIVALVRPERYRISFFDQPRESDENSSEVPDGMAELWFKDMDHFDGSIGRGAPPNIDADNFSKYGAIQKGCNLFTIEHLNVDGRTNESTTKLVFFVKRKDGIERAHFDDYWLNVHIPNVTSSIEKTSVAKRYTVDFVDRSTERTYDGIAQIYIDRAGATFSDIEGYEPDGFGELVKPMLVVTGHEVKIVE